MSRRFSDDLPSFKKDQPEEEEVRGHERFVHWVEEGFKEGGRRESGPMLRMAGLLVIILCLGWSASRPAPELSVNPIGNGPSNRCRIMTLILPRGNNLHSRWD